MKGRGRPKGWRPGMSYSEMRGGTAPNSRPDAQPKGSAMLKRRGRPPKQPSPPPEELYRQLTPQFLAYLCEWKGCEAELHNLDTLRRHVYKVHGGTGSRSCQWSECGQSAKLQTSPLDERTFRLHIEEEHLVPMSWHVGDGTLNQGGLKRKADMEDELPDYLLDAQGKQITPSTRDQELEDYSTWLENRRKLRELLKRRDENLPSDESDSEEEDEVP